MVRNLEPIAFIVCLIAALAELSRVPFDLPESENELVAGFQTEYSGFRWAMFYLAEYVYAFAMSVLAVVLFLGGWKPLFPFLDFIPGAVWFGLKFAVMVFGLNWIRATSPRVRPDHLMEFAWKVLLPISLANIFLTAIFKEVINLFKKLPNIKTSLAKKKGARHLHGLQRRASPNPGQTGRKMKQDTCFYRMLSFPVFDFRRHLNPKGVKRHAWVWVIKRLKVYPE